MKTAIRNLLDDYPSTDYSLRFVREFRISELTSNVPFAVRSTFRNDNIVTPITFNRASFLSTMVFKLPQLINNTHLWQLLNNQKLP